MSRYCTDAPLFQTIGVWLFAFSSIFFLLLAIYRSVWGSRFRFPFGFGGNLVRVRGRITGPGEPGRVVYATTSDGLEIESSFFDLERDGRRISIAPSGAYLVASAKRHRSAGGVGAEADSAMGASGATGLSTRSIRVGDRVVVDGLITTFAKDESLYRESAALTAVDAVRIAKGALPEAEWLRYPILVLGLIALLTLGLLIVGASANMRFSSSARCASVRSTTNAHHVYDDPSEWPSPEEEGRGTRWRFEGSRIVTLPPSEEKAPSLFSRLYGPRLLDRTSSVAPHP